MKKCLRFWRKYRYAAVEKAKKIILCQGQFVAEASKRHWTKGKNRPPTMVDKFEKREIDRSTP